MKYYLNVSGFGCYVSRAFVVLTLGFFCTLTTAVLAANDTPAADEDVSVAPLDVNIRPELPYVVVDTPNGEVRIQREQDQAHVVENQR